MDARWTTATTPNGRDALMVMEASENARKAGDPIWSRLDFSKDWRAATQRPTVSILQPLRVTRLSRGTGTQTVKPMIRIQLLLLQPLLNAGVQALLSRWSDLTIVGIETDRTRAMERATEVKPDVVIADSRDTATDSVLLRLLKEGIAPVVIVLDAAENRLHLYRSEEWPVNEVEDLEQAIRAEPLLGLEQAHPKHWHVTEMR